MSGQNMVWKVWDREKIKIIFPLRSYLTGERKFQKNSKKIKMYHYGIISSQNTLEKAEKETK